MGAVSRGKGRLSPAGVCGAPVYIGGIQRGVWHREHRHGCAHHDQRAVQDGRVGCERSLGEQHHGKRALHCTVGNTRFMAVAAQGQSFLASLGAPGTRMSVEWKVAFNVSMMAHPKQAIVFLEGVAGDVLIVTVSNPSSPESDVPTTCAVDVSSPTSAAKYMWCYSALDDIVTVAVGGDLVLFGLGSTNTVLAVDASTGKEAWKGTFPFPLSRGQVFSSSARIFLQNAPGPDPICLYEIDANNGSVVDLSPLLPPSTQATMDIWSTTLGGASITDDVLIWTYIAPNNNGQSCMTLIQVPGRE